MVGHGPQGRSKFRNVCRIFFVSNAYKKKKNAFFGRMPRGGGGVPWWTGGRPRALIPEGVREGLARASGGGCKGFGSGGVGGRDTRDGANFVGGGVGAMAVPKKGEGWGLVGCSKEEQVQGRGQARVGLAVGGGARASVASFLTRTKRRKMVFFEGCPVGWGGVPTGAGLVDGG